MTEQARVREARSDAGARMEDLADRIVRDPATKDAIHAIAIAYRADRTDDADRLTAYVGLMLLFCLDQLIDDDSEIDRSEVKAMASVAIRDLATQLNRAARQPSYRQPVLILLVLNALMFTIMLFHLCLTIFQSWVAGF